MTAPLLARLRDGGLTVELDGEHVVIRGPRRLADLAREAAACREDLRAALVRERAAWVRLRAELAYADRCEAAARDRGEKVPDPDDARSDYWAWLDAQLPPPMPSAPPPRQVVTVWTDAKGRLRSGSLRNAAMGEEIAP